MTVSVVPYSMRSKKLCALEKAKTKIRGTSVTGCQGVPEHDRQEAAFSLHNVSRGCLGGWKGAC